jgi:predicted PurR-regulated permease PerM
MLGAEVAQLTFMTPTKYPTPWQQKTIWTALTTVAVVSIGAIAVLLVWLASAVISFLQPILIPFAVAGVLSYLLEPVVSQLADWRIPRKVSVPSVFAAVAGLLLWGCLWLIPVVSHQVVNLYKKVDQYAQTTSGYFREARNHYKELKETVRKKTGVDVLPALGDSADEEPVTANPPPAPTPPATVPSGPNLHQPPAAPDAGKLASTKNITQLEELFDFNQILKGDWIKTALTTIANNSLLMIRSSVGGFMSVFGFLVSLIIIPVYLFYFLIDARNISASWQDYLPLKNSEFKTEVVSALTEINGYIIAFFRGQLLVSVINGVCTAIGLMIVGLDFGLLIGLVLCLLGLIPYLGILLCWIPAVIIAFVQHGEGSIISSEPVWLFPLVVTGIFVLVQKIDSFYLTPKVVEKRVGLHPLTVIVSIFAWSLLLPGLLGTIIAVPLTATLKVLLRRYAWERRILGKGAE